MKQTSSQPRLDGKIPGRIKYTFALGALGKDMIYGMIATFSMIYFTDIIKVNPVFIGVMFFVAKLWDAFNDLFMGMIVDNTRSRWGKLYLLFYSQTSTSMALDFAYLQQQLTYSGV